MLRRELHAHPHVWQRRSTLHLRRTMRNQHLRERLV
jgi:hypothetical protein